MKTRYEKNSGGLSEAETRSLWQKHVCVVGCGGLGGYAVELLARVGVGHITVADGDVFSESNLNRQLFSTEANLGERKVEAARLRVAAINSEVTLTPVAAYLTEENAAEILAGCDIAVDALDNARSRKLLARACGALEIPLVHGAIGGWSGQVAVIPPGSGVFDKLYAATPDAGEQTLNGSLPFVAAATASAQCAEVIKLLTGRGEPLAGALARFDLLTNTHETYSL